MYKKNNQKCPLKRYSFFQRLERQNSSNTNSILKSSLSNKSSELKSKSQILPYLQKISQIIKSTDYIKNLRDLQPKLKLRSLTTSQRERKSAKKQKKILNDQNWVNFSSDKKVQYLKVKMKDIKTPQKSLFTNFQHLPVKQTIESNNQTIENELPKLSKRFKTELNRQKVLKLKRRSKINKNNLEQVQDEIIRKNKLNFLKTSLANIFRSIRQDIQHQRKR